MENVACTWLWLCNVLLVADAQHARICCYWRYLSVVANVSLRQRAPNASVRMAISAEGRRMKAIMKLSMTMMA